MDVKELYCSFCSKGQKEAAKLIAGPSVYICDECIELCNEILEEEEFKDKLKNAIAGLTSSGECRISP